MSVTSTHNEYDIHVRQWIMVKDCVRGEAAVKAKADAYLPVPNPEDRSEANRKRYEQYLRRAVFTNFTGRTKKGLVGAVFRKPPVVDLPDALQYIIQDATKTGMSLENLAKLAVGEVLEAGRAGVLADYPRTDGRTLTAEEAKLYAANLAVYSAENIINWHVSESGRLDLVVLREIVEETEDGFVFTPEYRYRVLLIEDGRYIQRYYDDAGVMLWEAEPRKADNSTFGEIPWSWIGAEDNDHHIDPAPLYDIAAVNLAHYRNSADYEESVFFVGQPTPVVSGLTAAWVEQMEGRNYLIGSRAAWLLPEGGSAALLQANPNSMASEAMRAKEEQMVMIGARIIQDGASNETAEAARIRASGENSMLATVANNVSSAFQKALRWVAEFMGANPDDVDFILNTEFFDSTLDPQTVIAQMQLVDRGDIARSDLRRNLRLGNWLDNSRTDEDIDSEAGEYLMIEQVDKQ